MDAPLALYRRYRPETFAEVIGQDHVTEPLRNALANNRVNHAYLFSGPRGCGKTTSARILARAINCEKGPAPEPCGECQSCQDLARGGPGSIDVIEIDAASHGGVDDARDLRERAFFSPVQSRFKIYIIDEAHMVTTQGFNALLKLVEEPPPHLKFIFATTEPEKVIGTIRSRTHHYPFRLVPPKVLAAYLAQLCSSEGVSIEPAALPLVVRAGAGSVRDSLSVLDQLIGGAGPEGVTYALAVALLGFTPDSLLDAIMDGFAARDSAAVFGVIDKVIETGQDPKRFAEDLLRRLRDLVIVAAVPTAVSSGLIEVAEDQGERLQAQAATLGPAELTRAADTVAAGLLDMRGATAPRLQLELICAKVLLPGADDTTQGVHARLDRIERRMTLGTPADAPAIPSPTSAIPGPTAAVPGPSSATPGPSSAATAAEPEGRPVRRPARAATDSSSDAPTDPSSGASTDSSSSAAAGSPAGPGSDAAADPSASGNGRPAQAADEPVRREPGAATAAPSPAGVEPATGDVPAGTPDHTPAAAASNAPAGSGGQIGLADVRRLWPDILQRVKERKKVTWVMLSQNAQVLAMDDSVLTIGLSHAGVRDNFVRSGHDDLLREAIRAELLVDRRIEAVVDPSTAGAGSSTPSASAAPPAPAAPAASAAAAASSSWDTPAAPSDPPAQTAPADPSAVAPTPSPQPPSQSPSQSPSPAAGASKPADPGNPAGGSANRADGSANRADGSADRGDGSAKQSGGPAKEPAEDRKAKASSKRRAAEAAAAALAAETAAATPVREPDEPADPLLDEADHVGEDDVVLEEDARSHTDLLRETLGAQIIDEQPNA